ncbi:MAG: sensor histidine kinase [Terriglobales bacterium]
MASGSVAGHALRWRRLGNTLSARLIVLLLAGMVVIFALLGYLNIRLHRRHLEKAMLLSAERMSDVVQQATTYHMLRNDREALYQSITTMASEPGVVRIRIFNQEGRISFSSDASEVNSYVDKRGEACYACHAQAQPLTKLNRPDRFRIFKPSGHRVLGIITPIENQPSCSTAACHAHPAEQQVLGVLDTNVSLARADADLKESSIRMLAYTLLAVLLIAVVSGIFVWRVVHIPVKKLTAGTNRLARGELGYQLNIVSRDELGELALSFNQMSRQLREAREEADNWAQTLEARVEDKTRELKHAHQAVMQSEKMASIGKLAATVAHEINNPLAGILTYAKLLRKWLDRDGWSAERRDEVRGSLELIECESRRCGEIVRNLLTFSRSSPMNLQWVDLNQVIDRCVRLVQHQSELNNVQLQPQMAEELPQVQCDAAQIEQLLLALIMNAVDALPHGGNLWVRSRMVPEIGAVQLEVQDDGVGIPESILPNLFEPFFTTKEKGHGVGLGLAISKGIVERHRGRIDVDSKPGQGTRFTITLPVDGYAEVGAAPAATAGKAR